VFTEVYDDITRHGAHQAIEKLTGVASSRQAPAGDADSSWS
jgi:hypothetical protein